jgi:hypothetical protein
MTKEDLKKASDSDLKSQMGAANDAFFNSKGLTSTQEKGLSRAYKDAKTELESRAANKLDKKVQKSMKGKKR